MLSLLLLNVALLSGNFECCFSYDSSDHWSSILWDYSPPAQYVPSITDKTDTAYNSQDSSDNSYYNSLNYFPAEDSGLAYQRNYDRVGSDGYRRISEYTSDGKTGFKSIMRRIPAFSHSVPSYPNDEGSYRQLGSESRAYFSFHPSVYHPVAPFLTVSQAPRLEYVPTEAAITTTATPEPQIIWQHVPVTVTEKPEQPSVLIKSSVVEDQPNVLKVYAYLPTKANPEKHLEKKKSYKEWTLTEILKQIQMLGVGSHISVDDNINVTEAVTEAAKINQTTNTEYLSTTTTTEIPRSGRLVALTSSPAKTTAAPEMLMTLRTTSRRPMSVSRPKFMPKTTTIPTLTTPATTTTKTTSTSSTTVAPPISATSETTTVESFEETTPFGSSDADDTANDDMTSVSVLEFETTEDDVDAINATSTENILNFETESVLANTTNTNSKRSVLFI